jgi:hypothetical protein
MDDIGVSAGRAPAASSSASSGRGLRDELLLVLAASLSLLRQPLPRRCNLPGCSLVRGLRPDQRHSLRLELRAGLQRRAGVLGR